MNNPVSKQISVLRIMETLGVIFIHTCNTISNNKEMYDLSTGQYTLLKIGYTSMHWAVPIFFMITGSLLLNPQKKIELSDCVCKYVKKVIVALFIFGTLFAGIEVFVNTHILSIQGIIQSVKNVIAGNSWGHLWYLYDLIGVI